MPHLPQAPLPGTTWVDSIRTNGTTTINHYRVLKKEGDQLQLALTSQLAPGSALSQTGNGTNGEATATGTVTKADYAGELRVRLPSGFVEELHLTKHTATIINAAGRTLTSEAYAKLDLTNTMQ